MTIFSPKKILLALFISATFYNVTALACSCGGFPSNKSFHERVTDHVTTKTAVFTGKVIGFDYRKGIRNEFTDSQRDSLVQPIDYETKLVKVEVHRWWRSQMQPLIFLVTDTTKNSDGSTSVSGCDYNFKVGETYLVFASGAIDALKTDQCSWTSPIIRAKEMIDVLGEGFRPVEPPSVKDAGHR